MSATEFGERYDERIAAQMLQFGSTLGGLPAYLGIELVRIEPGRLWARANLEPELITPSGNVHGGALAAILDHVTGAVVYPLMAPGCWGATTELKLNYVTAVQAGAVEAHASVLAMTKRSAVVRGELHSAERLVCAAQGTITIVTPRA
ncbi:PaaI family thioesterase [Conexibacter sp. DBS9H8]|uniref:PaaI family thioesterase n=1 Tax=Conexibacter sp. DBS9H8 TaxID=2937801 RepID=UPI00200C69F9|nr:PaaI family thioesterase [Conexibacter sp. DBS9H8]